MKLTLTYEFESEAEVIKFLNTVISDTLPSGGNLRTLEDVVDDEVDKMEADDPPVRKRKSRVGRGSSEAASVRKKGKGKKKDAPDPNYKAVSDEIMDADLSKAASIAAGEITPLKVTAILEQFGVGQVSDLKDEQRREFLDLLDEAIEAGK